MELSETTRNGNGAIDLYAKTGLLMIPLCSPKGEHRHKGESCKHPGKVPLEKAWQKQAGRPMDEARLKNLERHKGNFGLPIPPGMVALDSDSPEDFQRLGELLRAAGLKFWCQRTGRGGHFLLLQPTSGEVRNAVKRKYDGTSYDVRGVGGQVVVFPSVHVSGAKYVWEVAPWDLSKEDLSVLPERFVKVDDAAAVTAAPSVENCASLTEGRRNDALFRFGCSLRSKGRSEEEIYTALSTRNAKRCSPPLTDEEVRHTAKSAARYEPGASKPEPPVDLKAELETFRGKWPSADEKGRDDLLAGIMGHLEACSVLQRERAMEEIQKLTEQPRRLLNKVLTEQVRRINEERKAAKIKKRQTQPECHSGLMVVPYNVNRDRLNDFFGELAVALCSEKRLYNHHGELVYIQPGKGIRILNEKNLPGLISNSVEIACTAIGENGPEFKGYPPLKSELASAFLHSPRVQAMFPFLNQYTRSPVFGADWDLIATPGYHSGSGVYYDGPEISPSKETGLMRRVLDGFCWKSTADLVNYVGMLLTGITIPHWLGKHPMIAFNANKPGAGKSTAARVGGIITEGKMPVSVSFNPNDEEFEKQLATRIGMGDRTVIIDNAKKAGHAREVESPVLERSITDPVLNYRRLGSNQAISKPNDVTFSLTMNFTKMSRDLRRRSIPINLHREENVRDVKFPIPDLEAFVVEHRSELLAELCGMVMRRLEAGKLELDKPARHSVSQVWAETIDGILRCSDFHGFLDNLEESEHAFDPDYQSLVEICAAHKDQSPITATEWAALLSDSILEAKLKDRGGKPKPLRSQATIVGSLFNQYLDTPIDIGSGSYLIACDDHGVGHPSTYSFQRIEKSDEARG